MASTSLIYDRLKTYINMRIDTIHDSLKDLFDDYKVKDVGDNIDNVKAAGDNKDNIDTVADNIDPIKDVSNDIDSVKNVSDKLDDVRNYASTYIGASDDAPDSRNDGYDLQDGDLYFNSDENRMKVYNADDEEWIDIGTTVKGIKKTASFTGDGDTKEFDVDGGYDADNGIVFLNGSVVTEDVDISDGSKVKFDDAPADDDEIDCIFFGSFETSDIYEVVCNYYVDVSDDKDVDIGNTYLCDSSDDGFTLTLPDSANKGQKIIIVDVKKTFDDNNVILDRNGNNIDGKDEDYTCDVIRKYEILCVDDDHNWRVL